MSFDFHYMVCDINSHVQLMNAFQTEMNSKAYPLADQALLIAYKIVSYVEVKALRRAWRRGRGWRAQALTPAVKPAYMSHIMVEGIAR